MPITIIGPKGSGTNAYVPVEEPVPYTIRFSNDPFNLPSRPLPASTGTMWPGSEQPYKPLQPSLKPAAGTSMSMKDIGLF